MHLGDDLSDSIVGRLTELHIIFYPHNELRKTPENQDN